MNTHVVLGILGLGLAVGLVVVLGQTPPGGFAISQLPIPSLIMVFAVFVYAGARQHGAGQGLGENAIRQVDRLVFGSLVAAQGAYALLCRGVAWTGFIATAALTAFYVLSHRANEQKLSRLAMAVIAFAWLAVLYRYLLPRTSGFLQVRDVFTTP